MIFNCKLNFSFSDVDVVGTGVLVDDLQKTKVSNVVSTSAPGFPSQTFIKYLLVLFIVYFGSNFPL